MFASWRGGELAITCFIGLYNPYMELHKRFTLYVDESGVANLAETQTKFFVLAGIVVEESTDHDLSAYFNYIKRRYSLPEHESFHAVSFFDPRINKRRTNPTVVPIPLQSAKGFSSSISEFIENTPFEVMVIAIKKSDVGKLLKMPRGYGFKGTSSHKKDKDVIYEIAARKLFLQFASLLKRKKAYGAIVAESRRKSDSLLIDTFLDCQEETNFSSESNKRASRNVREQVVSICFKNKKAVDATLQIADLFSYATYQHLCKKITPEKKKRGLGILWKTCSQKIRSGRADLNILISPRIIKGVASDRINKITSNIQERLNANSDLVNPTRR
jgi:hypothetical protein